MGSSCSCRYSWDVIRCRLIAAAHRRKKKENCRCVMRRPKFLRRRRKVKLKCTCSRRHCILNKPRCQKPPICSRESSPCCPDEASANPEPYSDKCKNKSRDPSPCLLTKIPILCGPKKESKEPTACGKTKIPVCAKAGTSPSLPSKSPLHSFRSEACGTADVPCSKQSSPKARTVQRRRSDASCGPDSPSLGPPCLRSRGQSPKGCGSDGSRSASPSPSRPASNAGSVVPQQLCACGAGPKNVCRFTIDAYFT